MWRRILPEAKPPLDLRVGADVSTHQCVFEGDVLVAEVFVDGVRRVTLPTERNTGGVYSGYFTTIRFVQLHGSTA